MKRRTSMPHANAGFSYAEVLAAALLLAIALVPMMDAVHTATLGAQIQTRAVEDHFRLTARLEEVLSEPFTSLQTEAATVGGSTVATSYSDAPGTAGRRLVFLSPFDADNVDADDDPFTGTDADILWVRVALEDTNMAIETLSIR